MVKDHFDEDFIENVDFLLLRKLFEREFVDMIDGVVDGLDDTDDTVIVWEEVVLEKVEFFENDLPIF